MALDFEDKKRLLEIRNNIQDLTQEIKNLLRLSGNKFAYERASAYWLGHLDNVVQGISKHDSCMNETLSELGINPELEPDDLREDEEDEEGEWGENE